MRFSVLLFALLVIVSPGAKAQEKIFNADSFTLDNGMEVVVIENHRAPVVTHMVWYKVGAVDEPRGMSGMAHFLEHMMFKGTPTLGPGEFSKKVRALGGNDNAFTSQDYTAFFQSIAAAHLETVMAMEADRMENLSPPEDAFNSELQVVIEERRERTDNDPRAYFYEQMRAALFVNHPYANPVIGWYHEVDALSWDNAHAFYKAHYAPNNAILVVSGDITAAELKPMAERTYGKIKNQNVPDRKWIDVPPLISNPLLTLHHPSIHQPIWLRLIRAPSAHENKQDARALEVLQNILDGGAATRLYKSLVVDQKLASSVNFSYNADQLSDALVSIQIVPAADKTMEEVGQALEAELRKIVADGVTETELRSAKDRMKDAAIYARDSLAGPAMIFGRVLVSGGTIDDLEYWPDQIEAVTADQIQTVARAYLNPDDTGKRAYVTGYMLPEEKTE